jgi:hypothetical protein
VIIANFTNHTLGILKLKYILYSVVEGRPLLAVDFSIFRGHSGQQAGHRRPVAAMAAAKFEACTLEMCTTNKAAHYGGGGGGRGVTPP